MEYPKSAYIHIPFCKSKCYYCAFVSTCNLNLQKGYLIALLKDIDTNYADNKLDTLYFGGGTPSTMPIQFVKKIINKFPFEKNAEITFELNPEDADKNYLEELHNLGINRLSIGAQSFNNDILKKINRRHDAQAIINAINLAKNIGFNNISVDFIYGLPNQTIEDFTSDLKHAIKMGIPHISLYGLKIEEKSVFNIKKPENLPDDDMQAEMYLSAIDTLKEYCHYEISNFAVQPEFKSKHNLVYWKNKEYYGFGCAAHGYENGIRYANSFDIHKYIENPLLRDFGHTETEKEKLEEEIFLGFRLSEGIDVQNINSKYTINFDKKYSQILEKYLATGHILETKNGYKLSNKGFLISNIILSEFI